MRTKKKEGIEGEKEAFTGKREEEEEERDREICIFVGSSSRQFVLR